MYYEEQMSSVKGRGALFPLLLVEGHNTLNLLNKWGQNPVLDCI